MSETTNKPVRSPSYPVISLDRAVQAVRKIEEKYRSSPVDRLDGAKLIGFSGLSGPAQQVLSALSSYGLVERCGKGEMRVTQRAKAILHPNNAAEKISALTAAAYEPQLYRDLRERFSDVAIPPEDGVMSYLNRQNFNVSAIRPAAKAFLATVNYLADAGASESHGAAPAHEGEPVRAEGKSPSTYGGAKVGDLIQWESQGALQLEKPLRVRAVSEDGAWLAVEGSETGIPMNEAIVEERAATERAPSPRFAFPEPIKEPDAIVKASAGEVEWMRSRLSQETNVRLVVKGEMGPREIGKLIHLLQAQKAVLEDNYEASSKPS